MRDQEEIISVISLILNQCAVEASSRRRILYIAIVLIEKSVRDISINNAINNLGVVALLDSSDGVKYSLYFNGHKFLLKSRPTNSVSVNDNLLR